MKNSSIMKIGGMISAFVGIICSGVGSFMIRDANKWIAFSGNLMGPTFTSAVQQKNYGRELLVVGIALFFIGIIFLIVGFFKANAVKYPETESTAPMSVPPTIQSAEPVDRLAQLQSLKESGLLTDDEYEDKRKQIIDEI